MDSKILLLAKYLSFLVGHQSSVNNTTEKYSHVSYFSHFSISFFPDKTICDSFLLICLLYGKQGDGVVTTSKTVENNPCHGGKKCWVIWTLFDKTSSRWAE